MLLDNVYDDLGLTSVLLLYLLLVVGVAALGGFVPAFIAAVAGFLLANYYFTPPIHTWTIEERDNLIALVVFVVIGAVVGSLVSRMARRKAEAFARAVARRDACPTRRDARERSRPAPRSPRGCAARSAASRSRCCVRRGATRWGTRGRSRAPRPARAREPDDADVTVPVDEHTVLALCGADDVDAALLQSFVGQLALVLERRRLRIDAAAAEGLAEANELRTALLAAVSHDLRTPLSAIKAAATTLLQNDIEVAPAERTELLEGIDEESDRLSTLVGQPARHEPSADRRGRARAATVGLDEIVPAALDGLRDGERRERGRRGARDAAADRGRRPRCSNARSRTSSPTRCTPVRRESRSGWSVAPCSTAWSCASSTAAPASRSISATALFQPFQRLGDQHHGNGVGLGLAVARGFVDVMGGELSVEDTPGGGATMVVRFPISEHGSPS